ncbi:hypothetical protein V7S43_012130 [Phytophthora oleae]|uniref:RanBP2-type domain-containing protein n=1 Tax=Phytophthora oleae TaxID=2107226 RepID=A0ABD3FAJ9_9STRA
MSRSRSQSRGRSTRRRLPRSRSRSRSRSQERLLGSRIKNRSRSNSPVDRRRSTRSRSPVSIASSRSGSEERKHKKHKKHSKKTKKEEKRRHKKHKHKKCRDEGEGGAEETATTMISEQVSDHKEATDNSKPVDVKSFFAQLQKQEAAKEPVGTVHARGLPAPVSATAISTSDKWECSKAGCGNMNSKHAPSCNKCGAMKRLTEWR